VSQKKKKIQKNSKKSSKKKIYKRDIMQLFSANATIFPKDFKYFFAHENMKKTLSKVAHNRPHCFSVLPTRPKLAQISYSVT
jgi:hypothetical protein